MTRIRNSLSLKLVIGFILLGTLICASTAAISYIKYKQAAETQYNDTAYRIAAVGLSYIDGDDIERYLETGETDDRYETMAAYLSKLRRDMKANYIYVARLDGIDLTYVYDVDHPDDNLPPFVLGDKGQINPAFREEAEAILTTGARSDNYFYSHSMFGYNTSAIVPVYNSQDDIVAILGVEVAMETLQSMLAQFIVFTVLASAVIIAVFIAIYLRYLRKHLVRPIRLMTDEAESFIESETRISERLKSIATGDEIEHLAQAIYRMEVDINLYIDNITAITAEKERIDVELGVATRIQTSMLPCTFPAFPDRSEFDICAAMKPAKEVGGDFYDFFMPDDRHLVVVIADVSGKGIPAALFMVVTKTLIKNGAMAGQKPEDIFTSVNQQLCENNDAMMFVTAWMGVLNIATGTLTYVNAGHEPPLLRQGDASVTPLKSKPGFVLGGLEDIAYGSETITLMPGDSLFLYTDGVTEATNAELNLYGEKRLRETLDSTGPDSPNKMLEEVSRDIGRFVGDAPQFDDITMLAVTFQEAERRSLTVDASLDRSEEVTGFIEAALAAFPDPVIRHFQIAADEIFSNIVNYSNTEKVSISCRTAEGQAELTFSDSGDPYDPLQQPDPDVTLAVDEREIGGLGVFIARKLMDSVSYKYKDGQNHLTVRKRIKP